MCAKSTPDFFNIYFFNTIVNVSTKSSAALLSVIWKGKFVLLVLLLGNCFHYCTSDFSAYSPISLTSVGLMSVSTTASGISGVLLQMSDNDGLIQ